MSVRLHPHKPELVLDARAALGEGPVWDKRCQRLFWVDILAKTLHRFDPTTGCDASFHLGQSVGCAVMRKTGGLMVGLQHGFGYWNDQARELHLLNNVEVARPGNRFNDGKCDPAGRFWAGTMDSDAQSRQGSLYCLDYDHRVRRVLRNLSIPNGITWSRNGKTMFFIDSAHPIVWAFDFDLASGRLSHRRPAFPIPPGAGIPDGMTIDAEGMLWVALWGGGCVTRWNPRNGKLIQKVLLPVSLVSSCAFGGRDLDILYITSARSSSEPASLYDEPLAGGLFGFEPGICGLPDYAFNG